jgi:APA family basic amino acid/polyamine antiporter
LTTPDRLKRDLGLPGAIVTGLGSILGTGAFVAIALASGQWGDAVLWAVPLAALVAMFNGLSSAFLAGKFPVAGGTYESGYRTLGPWLGFSAGWLFLMAKTASAATAALGVSLYLGAESPLVPIGAVAVVTLFVLGGIKRTAIVNVVLVTITVLAILWFAWNGLSGSLGVIAFDPTETGSGVLPATAFLFVAYTGYGRIATLGEEVRDPARVIPRAVVITLLVAAGLYMLIELGGRAWGGERWGSFLDVATILDLSFFRFGAITAMLGVLLNLILGLSRVWLAMGRRDDMPATLSRLDRRSEPTISILLTGALVAAVTLIGDIGLAWSFSAMTVLLYYGATNLAALAVDRTRKVSWLGMASCLFLSFFVPLQVWVVGIGLLVLGWLWKAGFARRSR